MTKTSFEAFEVLVTRSGLSLTPDQKAEIHKAWLLVEPMLERVRAGARERGADSALVFQPWASGKAKA